MKYLMALWLILVALLGYGFTQNQTQWSKEDDQRFFQRELLRQQQEANRIAREQLEEQRRHCSCACEKRY